jgi:hypothetical protein
MAIKHSDTGEKNGILCESGVGIWWLTVAFWFVVYPYSFDSRVKALL